MKTVDLAASLFIGGVAACLMFGVSRNLALPAAVGAHLAALLGLFPLLTLTAIVAGSYAGRRVRVAYQFTKYAIVGGLNFLVDLGVLNLLVAMTDRSQGGYASLFKAISFLVAMTWSFFWNKFWTFRSSSASGAGAQFVGFFLVSAAGLSINVVAFALVNGGMSTLGFDVPPRTWTNIAAAAAAMTSILCNFLGYKFVVFGGSGDLRRAPRSDR